MVIPERAIEISTDLSGVVICPKSIIQNLNQLLDAVSNHGVIVGRYVKQAFSNPNEARFYVGISASYFASSANNASGSTLRPPETYGLSFHCVRGPKRQYDFLRQSALLFESRLSP